MLEKNNQFGLVFYFTCKLKCLELVYGSVGNVGWCKGKTTNLKVLSHTNCVEKYMLRGLGYFDTLSHTLKRNFSLVKMKQQR